MKAKGLLISASLACAAFGVPSLVHSVTLGGAQKTPCLFGALGERTQCEEPRSAETLRLEVTPKSSRSTSEASGISNSSAAGETERSSENSAFTEGTPPSEKIQQTENEEAEAETEGDGDVEEVATVPLPFGGALLLSSIGLMLLANRKKS